VLADLDSGRVTSWDMLLSESHFLLLPIEVATPVARCPPRRSRRAEFPQRAPQESAHTEPVPTQSARTDSHCKQEGPDSGKLDTVFWNIRSPGGFFG